MARTNQPKYATRLNLRVLGRIANGRREFPNKIASTSTMRRCMKLGLVEVCAHDVSRLRVTDVGYTALMDAIITRSETYLAPDGEFTSEVVE